MKSFSLIYLSFVLYTWLNYLHNEYMHLGLHNYWPGTNIS